MTELELYKFITDNSIEWHHDNSDGVLDVIVFLHIYELADFMKICGSSIFDEDGIDCVMKDGYIAVWMNDICNYHGIEINNIFIS